jgi:hypothetical protein
MISRHGIVAISAMAAALAPATSMAQTETVLQSFFPNSNPDAAPLINRGGTLFEPTYSGHEWGDVTKVFMSHGGWNKQTVFTFDGGDGENPSGSLILASGGVMYGLTNFGGTSGYGTVYSLSTSGHGWNESVLYNFSGGSDGGQPRGMLARDGATGIIYGTADGGGAPSGCGTAYTLTPSNGAWSYNVIYAFGGGSDGCYPGGGIPYRSGNGALFGTTAGGGGSNDGTVFELTQSKDGAWHNATLYAFKGGNDGIYPGDLVSDGAGDLFGVASGGANGAGVIYELTKVGGTWQQSVLYSFTGGSDGGGPVGLTYEPSTGTIFGATQYGGSKNHGTVFKLVSNGASWTESVMYSFGVVPNDGRSPASRPVEDLTTGGLYGTTSEGGRSGGGTLYQITQ